MYTHLAEDASVDKSQNTDYRIAFVYPRQEVRSEVMCDCAFDSVETQRPHRLDAVTVRTSHMSQYDRRATTDWSTSLTEGLTFGLARVNFAVMS